MIAKIAMQVIMARQRVSLYQLALANVLLMSQKNMGIFTYKELFLSMSR